MLPIYITRHANINKKDIFMYNTSIQLMENVFKFKLMDAEREG